MGAMKKYKQAPEKRNSKPVKSPYGVIATCQYLQLDPIYYGWLPKKYDFEVFFTQYHQKSQILK